MIAIVVLIVAALAIGGLLAALMLRDPGYVLISYDSATLETGLWFALGVLLALWAALAAALHLARRVLRSGSAIDRWRRARSATRAENRSLVGWMLLAEERWQEAGRALLAAGQGRNPLANYVGAARAASALGRDDERDAALRMAREAHPQAAFVIELIRSELQQAAGQWQSSLATLEPLRRQAPRHPLVLARLFAARRALGDWQQAAELAPLIGDDSTAAAEIETAAWRARLAPPPDAPPQAALDHARKAWQAMPARLRGDEAVLLDYVDVLAEHSVAEEAEKVLRQGLKRHWRDAWVRRYGLLAVASTLGSDADSAVAARCLRTATGWLRDHGGDGTLLLSLARLALAAGDRPKARRYLEESLQARPGPEVLEALGRLSAADGDSASASGYFERALRHGRGRDATDTVSVPASS